MAPQTEPVLERPHPLSPLAKGWIAILALLAFILRDLPNEGWDALRRMGWLALGIIGVVLIASLLTGYLNWRFTRFVIDDEQVRIERRFISHRSERIAFNKIQSVDISQPLVARLLGLAALRIDVGGTGSQASIEYLSRQRAYQLRDYLITRAHGTQATVQTSAQLPVGGLLADRSAVNTVVVSVPPTRLVGSLLASGGTVLFLVFGTVSGLMFVVTGNTGALLSTTFLIPWLLGLGAMVLRRIRNEWNFTLTTTPDGGLRTSSGLTSLVSQTIPRDRVQAVDITQPLLWRPFGWHRVRIDVLGLKIGSDDQVPANLLLPVGSCSEVAAALDALWPRLGLAQITMHPIPRRARRFRWFDAHTYAWGFNQHVLVSKGRLLNPRTSIVPHARVQSVRLAQGILQRWARLASVQAHTTPGPVDVVCRHLDESDARALAMSELDRMRAGRRSSSLLDARLKPPPLPWPPQS